MKKALHAYKIEFRIYDRVVAQDTHVVAYSPKQAKKFFYDAWKNHHTTYVVVILVSELDTKEAENLLRATSTHKTLEDRYKYQCDYIYGGAKNGLEKDLEICIDALKTDARKTMAKGLLKNIEYLLEIKIPEKEIILRVVDMLRRYTSV